MNARAAVIEPGHSSTRSSPAVDTRTRLQDVLLERGITRVADLTGLDYLGIPVFSAIRPSAATLTASTGKGLDVDTAWVSAVMESLEVRAAEGFSPSGSIRTSADDLRVGYQVTDLDVHPLSLVDQSTIVDWSRGHDLVSGDEAYVPTAAIGLRGWHEMRWQPPTFVRTSNGLAAGSCRDDAIVHALLELIERDAIAARGHAEPVLISPDEVCEDLDPRLLPLFTSGFHVQIELLKSLPGTHAAACFLSSTDTFQWVGGTGCDTSRQGALRRAVLEAAQSRLSVISGLRDDISSSSYRMPRGLPPVVEPSVSAVDRSGQCVPATVQATCDWLVSAIRQRTGGPIIACDLTPPNEPFPAVYQVFAPGLRSAPDPPVPRTSG